MSFCCRLPGSSKLDFVNFSEIFIYVFGVWGVRIAIGIGKGALLQAFGGSIYIPCSQLRMDSRTDVINELLLTEWPSKFPWAHG